MGAESFKERKLIIARHFIKEKKYGRTPDAKDIFNIWTSYFPADFRISKKRRLKIVSKGTYYKLEPKEDWPDVTKEQMNHLNNKFEKVSKCVLRYVAAHDLDKVDSDLLIQKKHQLRVLKKKYMPLGYKVILPDKSACSMKSQAQYIIVKKGFNKSGYFSELMDYAQTLQEPENK